MLSLMRKRAKYFYVLFILVILTFIFWGVGSVNEEKDASTIAVVGGVNIPMTEYYRAFDRTEKVYRQIYGEKYDAQMAENLNLKEKVLNSLINEQLVLLLASEMDIAVSDREVEESIVNDPVFARDGSFSKDVYERILFNNLLTTEYFEEMKRRELTVLKITRLIGEAVDVSASELEGLKGNEDTAKRMKELLLEAKRQKAFDSFMEGLKARYPVKVNEDLLP